MLASQSSFEEDCKAEKGQPEPQKDHQHLWRHQLLLLIKINEYLEHVVYYSYGLDKFGTFFEGTLYLSQPIRGQH